MGQDGNHHRRWASARVDLGQDPVEHLIADPAVRRDAIAHARALLRGERWCRAEEVASTLVDCLVGGRLP